MRLLIILGGAVLMAFLASRLASHGARARAAVQPTENTVVATLPFEYFRKHILVAMRIDNSTLRACMVDNGFNADIITESVARAIGLPFHALGGKTPNAEGFGEGSAPTSFLVEKTVTLGIKDFPILTGQTYVLDMAGFEDGMGVHFDCVLGLPLFAQYVVEIDYTKRLITLYDPRSFQYRGSGRAVPLQVAVPPTMEVGMVTPDGRTVKAVVALDLGSDAILDFQPSFQSKHHIMQEGQAQVPIDEIGLSGEFHMSIVRLPSVEFAGYKLDKPLVAFMHTAPGPSLSANDGFVGNALLHRFTVIFDYSRERVIFEPNSSFGDPFKGNMTGIKVDPESDVARGFEVVYVEERSPGAKAGVRSGDRIVQINGVLCSTLLFEPFREMFTAEGAPFVLKIHRGEQKIDVEFQTPRLP